MPGVGDYSLDDRYRNEDGTIYLSGLHALVRMLLDRARHDRRGGADAAIFVSGYEGSPLAGYDLELARNADLLRRHGIVHQPGLNEELAATAVSGSQLAASIGESGANGVTGFWYGKAPGLDRATDALRHANLIGTDPRGGAVALVGDDPAAKSSTVPSASEPALRDLAMPTFYPADPGEILTHGLHAVELSRACGLWAAMKVATNVADGSATARVTPAWQRPELSDAQHAYSHRPSARLFGPELAALEQSLWTARLPLAVEYLRRSGVNRILGATSGRIGIVAAGKTYLDVRQALTSLGVDENALQRWGIRLLKLGAVYPLDEQGIAEFADGLDCLVVVEEKRAFVEDAVKSALYGRTGAPTVYGKRAPDGTALFAAAGELGPDAIAAALRRVLEPAGIECAPAREPVRERVNLPLAPRTPYFCSGCPHNSSTKVAPGTLVGGGIGCHAMVMMMPPTQVGAVTGVAQMGGEGAQWIGMAPFVEQRHFVQNLGDGTFTHSGSLAVRAAVAAGVNITFKLLRNSAVAMTGGQQVLGELPLDRLVALLQAEGVRKIVVTSDDATATRRHVGRSAQVRSRDDLLAVQQELAAIPGVTVLIHDQECAAELRRKRRRGKAVPPARRVVINERVCEGCGDCGAKSNCLSVQPVSTEYGRKTRIDQSSCNLDFSCVHGDCPAFMTVTPAGRPAVHAGSVAPPAEPDKVFTADQYALRITGIGGTGVVTLAQVLATAAVLDGRSVRALDQTGLAQKGGAVVSDLKISSEPHDQAAKLADGECDLYLGCDSLVAADPANLAVAGDRTVAVVSTTEVPTGRMVVDTSAQFPATGRLAAAISARTAGSHFLDAAALARQQVGDAQHANVFLLGVAYQLGTVPIGSAAIEQAIRLNGVAAEANVAAFRHGRRAVADPPADPLAEPPLDAPDLPRLVESRAAELVAYQDAAYAGRYRAVLDRVRAREAETTGETRLSTAVARNLFKLMAYKDEYEVARLALDPAVDEQIAAEFGAGSRIAYHLHPPVLRALGLRHKIAMGEWMRPGFRALVALRRVRGTRLDPFGYTQVRRTERGLVAEYLDVIDRLLARLDAGTADRAVEIAELPDLIRGYEHVKLGNVATYHERLTALLDELEQPITKEAP